MTEAKHAEEELLDLTEMGDIIRRKEGRSIHRYLVPRGRRGCREGKDFGSAFPFA